MQKTAFITGVCGQDGAYLAQLLLKKDYRVHGMVRSVADADIWRLRALGIADQVELSAGDMQDEHSLTSIIKQCQPDEVYNLAALSFVGKSWEHAVEISDINAMGAIRLLNAVHDCTPQARFFQASTSEVFSGHQGQSQPDETTPLMPRNPYGASKVFAQTMTTCFREQYDMYACSGILFNHESPLRGLEFVTRKITDGVARIHLGLSDAVTLGNLDAERDWGFAGDFVEAMWLMLQQDSPDDFVIATGTTHSVQDFLVTAFDEVGITDWQQYVRFDERFARSNDTKRLCGSTKKAQQQLGWQPTVSFAELVQMMVEWDLKRLTSE